MDFDLKLQFFATTTFLGGGSLIVTLYIVTVPTVYYSHPVSKVESFSEATFFETLPS